MPTYADAIKLRNIPRSDLEKSIETAAAALEPFDPKYKGTCKIFRASATAVWPLVCGGTCDTAKEECKIMEIRGQEGDHSDLYYYLAICTCTLKNLPKPFPWPKKRLPKGTIIVNGTEY